MSKGRQFPQVLWRQQNNTFVSALFFFEPSQSQHLIFIQLEGSKRGIRCRVSFKPLMLSKCGVSAIHKSLDYQWCLVLIRSPQGKVHREFVMLHLVLPRGQQSLIPGCNRELRIYLRCCGVQHCTRARVSGQDTEGYTVMQQCGFCTRRMNPTFEVNSASKPPR